MSTSKKENVRADEKLRMAEATPPPVPVVKTIFVYPVKSCRGISVPQATITPNGLQWDRLWLIVNSKGRMRTQRALIQVELPTQAFSLAWKPNTSSFLVINAPGMKTLKIPMVQPSAVADGVSVWEWTGSAFDEGEEAAKWFSDFLGKPSRLVRFDEGTMTCFSLEKVLESIIFDLVDLEETQMVNASCIDAASQCRPANSDYARGHTIKFNDWYPFHLISQGSLNALNNHLPEPVPINRFRPNFVVDGCEPFSEDLWSELEINEFVFKGGELCYRCKVPTIDQETAVPQGSEPTETLMKFRSDKILRPEKEKHQGRVYIGQMLVCKNYTPEISKSKAIRVGDPVHVLKAVSSYDECII